MKRILIFILCALMLTYCTVLGTLAAEETTAEETTAEETTAEEVTFDPLHIVFNSSLTGKKNIVEGANGMGKGGISKTDAWEGYKIVISDTADPHMGINYGSYLKKTGNQPIMIENTPFVVLRVLSEDYLFDDFEIYYCAGEVMNFTEDCKTASDLPYDAGEGVLYFIFDLTDDAEGEFHNMRVDITGAEEDALMFLTDVALFATEEEALNWCGYTEEEQDTTEATTEAPTVEETEPEGSSEILTAPPVSTEKEDGCGSVIGASLATASLLVLGALCIKKKD